MFQCRKRQCYTRDKEETYLLRRNISCFNAASGNAIRATSTNTISKSVSILFQCRKRQCYTRDFHDGVVRLTDIEFQCRKRQCYTRDSVSRGPRNYWAQTEIFTTFPFFPRNGGIFRGHRVFKISENIMSPIDFQGLIVSTIFCCNLPCFSG